MSVTINSFEVKRIIDEQITSIITNTTSLRHVTLLKVILEAVFLVVQK